MRSLRSLAPRGLAAALGGVVAVVIAVGCSTPPPPLSTHNLERPSDMVFACVGLFTPPDGGAGTDPDGGVATAVQTPTVTGRPMSECHAPGRFDLPSDVTRRTFGFVANTARHELSVVDMDSSLLVDLDPFNPETNVAPLGVLPEQIAASDDGCRIVSANRGSCDITLVDVGTLMTPTLASEGKASIVAPRSTASQDIVVQGPKGNRLYVSPQEILFLPQDTSALAGKQMACMRDAPFADPVGWNATPGTPAQTQWKALVSYPTCSLVALVDLPSGIIVDSVKITPGADGKSVDVVNTGPDPDCPVHDFCDTPMPLVVVGGATADGGVGSDAGTTVPAVGDPFVNPTGTRPGPLAILPDGQRAYVGLGQAAFVAAIDIQPNKLVVPQFSSIPLHEGALGVERIRLSVDPYKATGTEGQFGRFVGEGPDRRRQYLYAIAGDGTVRVVDVSLGTRLLQEIECDANIDPRFAPDAADPKSTCWPADPPDFDHRRPLTNGPGIRLPAIPRDLAFADLKLGDTRETVLDGAFGFILTSSGAVYLLNIDPTLRTQTLSGTTLVPSQPPEQPPLVNSLRDHNWLTFNSTLDLTLGPPRVDLAPVPPSEGPAIAGITTTSAEDNATDITGTPVPTYIFFPERSAVNRQTWNITWQGNYLGPSFSGQFTAADPAGGGIVSTLTDPSVDFCQASVLAGDTVSIYGCVNDAQCGPLQVCRRSATAPETAGVIPINGLCVPLDGTEQAKQIITCSPLLDTVRRYEVLDAKRPSQKPTVLTIRPKIDEVVLHAQQGCSDGLPSQSDAGADGSEAGDSGVGDAESDGSADAANSGAGGGARDAGSDARDARAPAVEINCPPSIDPLRTGFACAAVDVGQPARCVKTCKTSSDCRVGRTCVAFPGGKFCADGPPLDANLVNQCGLGQLTAYEVGVGNSFLIQGTAATPYISGLVDPTTFSCVRNPALVNRIPLTYSAAGNGGNLLPLCTNATIVTPSALTVEQQLLSFVGCTSDGSSTGGPCNTPIPTPNPCLIAERTTAVVLDGKGDPVLVNGTPVTITTYDGPPRTPPYRALFRNREITFVLDNLENYFTDTVQIIFDVHGGFLADTVIIPGTIDVEMPIRIVLSPIDSQAQLFDMSATKEIPYLYVVDQRRLGRASAGVGATRGQVLRINPRRSTTDPNSLFPIYEDYSLSGNLWPIQ